MKKYKKESEICESREKRRETMKNMIDFFFKYRKNKSLSKWIHVLAGFGSNWDLLESLQVNLANLKQIHL